MAYDKKIKRAYTASIHFKKSKIKDNFQVFHNTELRPEYAIGGDLNYNRTAKEAIALKDKIVTEAINTYKTRTNRAFHAKTYEWSAVCNIKDSTTMQDLEKLTEHFLKKYGFQCYQIAIHRDEGHINEQGEKVINHHAHLEFITLDKETGRNRQRELSPSVLRQIQDEVAEILGMERGVYKQISKTKRIEPRKYAQMKEREKTERKELTQELSQEKTKNRELQAELTATKKELVGIFFKHRKGRLKRIRAKELESQNIQEQEPTTDSKELEALKELLDIKLQSIPKQTYENYCKGKYFQDNKEADKDYLQNFLIENTKPYRQQRGILESQKKKIEDLEAKLSDLSAKNQKNEDLPSQTNKNDFRAISDPLNDNFFKNIMARLLESVCDLRNDAPMKTIINALYSHFKSPNNESKESLEKATQEMEKMQIKRQQEKTKTQEQQRTQNQGRSL